MSKPLELLLVVAIPAACGLVAWVVHSSRRSPADREQKRRLAIHENGRLIEGFISDFRDGTVYYSYSWRGINYDTSQDLSALEGHVPQDPDRLIGAVTVKFLPNNPYNSMVVCEVWSGLPVRTKKKEIA
jgi:hypothetical protein